MKTVLFCFSGNGARLAEKLREQLQLPPENVHTVPKYAGKYGFRAHERLSDAMGTLFAENEALIFISAAGIAVRLIAPYIRSKAEDPAVLVIDDQGRFVIPVLSGHLGGANALAEKIAPLIGALPVVTTATDGAGRFSCDAWAAQHHCALSSLKTAKKVSAAILGGDVPVSSETPLPAVLPKGLVRGEAGPLGIYIGIREQQPFDETLRLIPRILTLGIGCRRGTGKDVILSAVRTVLGANGIDIRSVAAVASIDVKKDEAGLLQAAEALNAELFFFSADELNAVPGDFEESAFVRKTVGTGNVCERAAVLAGGTRIINKTAVDGVTVAAAVKEMRIEF